jgi:hypothetical protein
MVGELITVLTTGSLGHWQIQMVLKVHSSLVHCLHHLRLPLLGNAHVRLTCIGLCLMHPVGLLIQKGGVIYQVVLGLQVLVELTLLEERRLLVIRQLQLIHLLLERL